MLRSHIKLGKVLGIEIGLHYTWLIIALLITLSLVGHFSAANPDWGSPLVWFSAIVTGLLFFAAIVAHELSHSVVARARGLPVRSITLFALGGVAQIEKEASDPRTEFWVGIAGPIASVSIGFACLALAWVFGWDFRMTPMSPLLAILVWLGYINILLAIFNMIPGFPLDGGRVLRAIVWWKTGDALRATRIASRIGQLIAIWFIVVGLIRFFGGSGFGGLWISFIGFFLLEAARATYAHVEIRHRLEGVLVRDVMSRDCAVLDGGQSIQSFVDEYLLKTGRRCFMVVEAGEVAGLITPHEVKHVPRDRWAEMSVLEAMRPLDDLRTVSPDTPLFEAFQSMGGEDVNQMPVVSAGRLEGLISRGDVIRFLQTRALLED